jgi:biopolymer transport protein ExbB
MTFDVVEAFRESFVMVILLLCSLVSITFIIERWLFFRKARLNVGSFMSKVKGYLKEGKFDDALKFCDSIQTPLSKVIRTGLANRNLPRLDLEEAMSNTRLEELVRMERFLGVLGTMGNTAPLIGLFGTVIGIMRAFHDLAVSGSGGPSVVAAGIAEALLTTAAGLVVAIPAVMLYNYYLKKVKNHTIEMVTCGKKLVILLKANTNKSTDEGTEIIYED